MVAIVTGPATPVDFCADVRVVGSEGQITVTGVNAPWQKIDIFGPSTGGVFRSICNDNCTDPQVITGLPPGQFIVRIEQSGNNGGSANFCTVDIAAIVTGPPTAPVDFCADVRVVGGEGQITVTGVNACLLYTSPSPRDRQKSRMPSSA